MNKQEKQQLICEALKKARTHDQIGILDKFTAYELVIFANTVLANLPLEIDESIHLLRETIHTYVYTAEDEVSIYHDAIKAFAKAFYKTSNINNKELIHILFNLLLLADLKRIPVKEELAKKINKMYDKVIPTMEEVKKQISIDKISARTIILEDGFIRVTNNLKLLKFNINN